MATLGIQFIQNPPIVGNPTMMLIGVPAAEVSMEPFTKLPNIMGLPLIKQFVEMGIVADKSTEPLGVLVITIHHVLDFSCQDSNGLSCPYIVLAYFKFGKPLYSTRMIEGDLDPVCTGSAFLLVVDEEVKGGKFMRDNVLRFVKADCG